MRIEITGDLLLINLLSALTFLANFLDLALKIVLAFPFLLFAPGYALIAVLFPRKDDLPVLERFMLSMGVSFVLLVVTGLLLHFTPFEITRYPILLSEAGLISLFSVIAWRRRKGEEFAYTLQVEWEGRPQGEKTYLLVLLVLILGVLIAGFQAFTTPRVEKFTEFYIYGPEGRAMNYPKNLTLNDTGVVFLGIRNHEGRKMDYRVVILLANETMNTLGGITLEHGEGWEEKVSFNTTRVGENLKLEFLLYKDEEPYRSLQLLLNVTRTGPRRYQIFELEEVKKR
jgi:uncharacterized membrane protein